MNFTVSSDFQQILYLYNQYVSLRKSWFGVGVLLLFTGLILARIPPLVIGVALDSLLIANTPFTLPLIPSPFVPVDRTGQVLLVLSALGVSILGEVGTMWYGRLMYEKASLETLHDVRTDAFSVTTELSVDAPAKDDDIPADQLSVIHDDVSNLTQLFDGLRDGVLYGGNIASAFLFMLLLNWNLALILFGLPIAIAITGRVYARLLAPRYEALRQSVGNLNTRLRDAIEGQATVRAYNQAETETQRIVEVSEEYRDSKWSALRLQAVYNFVSWLIAGVGIWGLFAFGSYWILAGPVGVFTVELTAGMLLTFILYTFSFLDPTRRIAVNVIDAIQDGRASADRITNLLTAGQLTERGTSGQDIEITDGKITYRNVFYRYPGAEKDAIKDVDMRLTGDEYVAIVGRSGAGKSTILTLLFRFRDPTSGTIEIDGQDITGYSIPSIRSHLGYVSQDPSLFPGTIEENIAYADLDVSFSQVRQAAARAGADEFISGLEDGYDTDVGEHGVTLSGGQKQRIAIARALVRDPAILILDEATSHVDNRTGVDIQEQIRSIAEDRTILSITHRVQTARHADEVLVMDDGCLVGSGTHDELVDADGVYAELWRIQTGELTRDTSAERKKWGQL